MARLFTSVLPSAGRALVAWQRRAVPVLAANSPVTCARAFSAAPNVSATPTAASNPVESPKAVRMSAGDIVRAVEEAANHSSRPRRASLLQSVAANVAANVTPSSMTAPQVAQIMRAYAQADVVDEQLLAACAPIIRDGLASLDLPAASWCTVPYALHLQRAAHSTTFEGGLPAARQKQLRAYRAVVSALAGRARRLVPAASGRGGAPLPEEQCEHLLRLLTSCARSLEGGSAIATKEQLEFYTASQPHLVSLLAGLRCNRKTLSSLWRAAWAVMRLDPSLGPLAPLLTARLAGDVRELRSTLGLNSSSSGGGKHSHSAGELRSLVRPLIGVTWCVALAAGPQLATCGALPGVTEAVALLNDVAAVVIAAKGRPGSMQLSVGQKEGSGSGSGSGGGKAGGSAAASAAARASLEAAVFDSVDVGRLSAVRLALEAVPAACRPALHPALQRAVEQWRSWNAHRASPSLLQHSVKSTLATITSRTGLPQPQEEFLTPSGLLIDFAWQLPPTLSSSSSSSSEGEGEGELAPLGVALEVDGPAHFLVAEEDGAAPSRSTSADTAAATASPSPSPSPAATVLGGHGVQLDAPSYFKYRMLEALRWQVVHVTYKEWVAQPTAMAREQYLVARLRETPLASLMRL